MNSVIAKKLSGRLCLLSAAAGVLLMLWLTFAGQGTKQLLVRGINFFGYFTIQTNLLVAVVAGFSVFGRRRPSAGLRSATLLYILVTAVVYVSVLTTSWAPRGWSFLANVFLHYATPLLYLLFWFVHCDTERPAKWFVWRVLVYPAVYLLFILGKGFWLGSYPYPFMDVSRIGLASVLVNALFLGVILLVLAWGLYLCHGVLGRLSAKTKS